MGKRKKDYSLPETDVKFKGNAKLGSFRGDRLRELREKMGLSRKDLAQDAKISLQTIARLELSHTVSSTDTLAILADFFKVPCGYLLGEDVLNLSEYGLTDELKKRVIKFLEKLMASQSPLQLLEAISIFLDTRRPEGLAMLVSKAGISEEEDVLGLWWSIVSAYQRGDWDTMITKSQVLINIAEGLGRPYLAALAHAYRAKAIRNRGGKDAVEKAEKELKEALKGEKFQSALTCRLIAKVYSRQQKHRESLEECKKAEEFMRKSNRDDALFLLEKVKLLRNIASKNIDLAQLAKKEKKESLVQGHLEEADTYLKLCKDTIGNLEKQLEREAVIEKMLLAFCTARYLEVGGKFENAVKAAEESLKLAGQLGQESYAVRVRMFLCRIYVELGKKDKAIHHYGSLFPLQEYSTGRYEWPYRKYIEPYEDKLAAYMNEQDAFLNRTSETRRQNKNTQDV